MTWNLVTDDSFVRANGAPGNGWVDVHGSVWSIVSHQLEGVGDGADSSEWSRDFLLRPTGENQLDQRIVTTVGAGNAAGAHLWHVHRYNPNSGTPTAYILEFELSAGTTSINFYRITGSSAVLLHGFSATVGSLSSSFTVDTTVTGANPTTLEMIVKENGTQISDAYYGPIGGGTGDSTPALQVSGQSGYTASPTVSPGGTIFIAEFQSYNDITQSISVSPTSVLTGSTGNTLTISGVATAFSGSPFAVTSGTITGQSVSSGTSATLTFTAPSAAGTVTITDTGSGKTCPLSVAATASNFTLSPSTQTTTPLVATGNYTVHLNGELASNETIVLSDGGAGGTFKNNGGSTITSLTFTSANAGTDQTFTYIPPSGSAGNTETLTASGTGAFTVSHTTACVVTTGPTTLAVSNANWFWSPYGWYFDGSGNAIALAPGPYFKLGFSGTSAVLNIQTSQNSGTQPKVKWSIDGGAWQVAQLSGTSLSLASGLASGSHTVDLVFMAASGGAGWSGSPPQINSLWISGLTIDGGATSIARSDLRSKRMLNYGDSITQGVVATGGGSQGVSGDDALLTYVAGLASALDAEYGQLGYTGQGYCGASAGGSGPPALFTPSNDASSSWNKQFSGRSRLTSGLFTPAPDYIVIVMGRNDYNVSSSTVAASVSGLLTAVRAAGPSAWVFVSIPFDGSSRTGITNGFNAYQIAAPDSKCVLLDTNNDALFNLSIYTTPMATAGTIDGTHPFYQLHGALAAELAAKAQAAMGGSGSAGYPRSRIANA